MLVNGQKNPGGFTLKTIPLFPKMEEEKIPEPKIPPVEYLRRAPTRSIGLEGFNTKGRDYYNKTVERLEKQENIKLIFAEENHQGRGIFDFEAGKYSIFLPPGDLDVLIHELTEMERLKKFGGAKNKVDEFLDHHAALMAQRRILIKFDGPSEYMEDVVFGPEGLIATEAIIKAYQAKGVKPTGGRPLPEWWYTRKKIK